MIPLRKSIALGAALASVLVLLPAAGGLDTASSSGSAGSTTEEPRPGPERRGPASVRLEGRGYGHGRGMSQYGAQGAASQHDRTYRQILRFYYPGTDLGRARGQIKVLITADTTDDVVVRNSRDLRVRRVGGESWALADGPSRWKLTAVAGGTRLWKLTDRWRPVRTIDGVAEFAGSRAIALVTPSGTTRYQGALRSAPSPDGRDTVNAVLLEDYLRGVVPREVPALWHPHAVRAQSVAARTYAAWHRARAGTRYYDLCDTTSCQVYGGVSDSHPAADAAIRQTAREILRWNGAPAFTEFSSSNGGWTVASSVPYQVAKRDPYDRWSGNPNRSWTVTLSDNAIEGAFPGIGDFRRLVVRRRDGNGAWNGRVLRVRIVGGADATRVSGDAFRLRFGLKSNWFRVA